MKILAIQLKRIGDAILTAPALAAAKTAHPGAHITLALNGPSAGLAPAFSAADTILAYHKNRPNARFWAHLAATRFDLSLDFCGNDRAALVTKVARATERRGYRRSAKTPIHARIFTTLVDASMRDQHTIDFHLALLPTTPTRPHDHGFAPPATPLPSAIPDTFALVHPGTARSEKYWHPDRWAAVIDHLHHHHRLPVVLTGSDDREEQSHIAAIRSHATSKFTDLSGQLSLLQLATLAARPRLAITVDSAASHLAAMAKTPQITLFGPTNPVQWHPRHDRAISLQGPDLEPFNTALKQPSRRPMAELSTGSVIRAIGTALNR